MFIYQLFSSSLRIKKEDIHKPYMSESFWHESVDKHCLCSWEERETCMFGGA